MEIILLIALGAIIIFITIVLLKSWLWQKKLSSHLNLSNQKNSQVLLKQGSFLALSVVAFMIIFNQQGYFANLDASNTLNSDESLEALEAVERYAGHEFKQEMDALDENSKVIGTFQLEDQSIYVLVQVDDRYYMVNEQENEVIEIESAP